MALFLVTLYVGIMGAIFQAFIPDAHLQSALFFDANFFMVVLLPAIIFESGYSLKKVRICLGEMAVDTL